MTANAAKAEAEPTTTHVGTKYPTKYPPEPEKAAVRTTPIIAPDKLKLDQVGYCTRSWQVRLPEGFIADDLKEPSIWSKVQLSRTSALIQHDRLYMIAYDQLWVAEARVSEADNHGVTLAGVRIIQMPRRNKVLFRDSNYGVAWDGAGYYVERLRDGHKMTSCVATEQIAERDLRALYPARQAYK